MVRKKTIRSGFVETHWKPFLDRTSAAQLRRGKALAKQGSVQQITVRDGVVRARVKVTGGYTESPLVTLPCVSDWNPYIEQVATWLSRRPDWLAALFADVWEQQWLDFLDTTGLAIFPDETAAERMVSEASCSCSERDLPCQHMLALVFEMIRQMQATPLEVFRYAGLDINVVLQRAHRLAMPNGSHVEAGDSSEELQQCVWPEERCVFESLQTGPKPVLRHRIAPEIDAEKQREWKERHMALLCGWGSES